MLKVITVLVLSVGGAAGYIWLRKHGRTSHLDSQISHAVNKAHDALTNDDASNDIAAKLKDKAHDVVENVTERVAAASS
jgi:hypothetical protein